MAVNSNRAKEYVEDCIKAGLVPFLKGSPGIGKSAIVKSIAEAYNLCVIDQRLSQSDPTDLNGFPKIENGVATYVPFDTFPVEGTEIPVNKKKLEERVAQEIAAGNMTEADIGNSSAYITLYDECKYDGWLLFLDEFNSAPLAVQAAAYKIVLDHEVGKHPLHENLAIVCAGNLESDNAIVNTISTAMQSRVVHIPMASDAEIWDLWAFEAGISHKIRDFIKFKPEQLNNFDPETTDATYGCERTWEFADKLLKVWNDHIPDDKLMLLQGVIGSGLAQEFNNYIKVYKEIPDYATIVTNPTGTVVPTEPDRKFAITGVLSQGSDAATIASAMQYILRLPLEFQVITLKDVIKKDASMANDPAVKQWVQANMNSLF